MSSGGVNVVGHVNESTGRGTAVQLLVDALRESNISHTIIPVGKRSIRQRARVPGTLYDTNIVCVNPDVLPGLVATFGHAFFRERRTIGFWWWEVESFPATLAAAAHIVDEVWVGSSYVADAISRAVSKPVHVFPVPIVRPVAVVPYAGSDVPTGRFIFLFSFSFASVFERKNPLGLIEAFSRAFEVNDGPVLVVKSVGSKRYPRELEALTRAVAVRPDVLHVERPLAREQYFGLVEKSDAYVSLHRAEGFGLTIAEAMALEKPAIATGYSGNLEFMSDANSYLIPFERVPIPTGLDPYPAGGRWAAPDLDAAADSMRNVVEQPAAARARVTRALIDIEEMHRVSKAGRFVADHLAAPRREHVVPDDPLERAVYEVVWGPDLDDARPWSRRLRRAVRPLISPWVEHSRRIDLLALESLRERRKP